MRTVDFTCKISQVTSSFAMKREHLLFDSTENDRTPELPEPNSKISTLTFLAKDPRDILPLALVHMVGSAFEQHADSYTRMQLLTHQICTSGS